MRKLDDFDELLFNALAPTEIPGPVLNQNIRRHLSEKNKIRYKKAKIPVLAAAILSIVMMLSVTGLAARVFLSPKQVAEQLFEDKLAAAFESNDAIRINETIESNDFSITLLGIVSGRSLQSEHSFFNKTDADKTYAVVSIAKKDGDKIPDYNDLTKSERELYQFYIAPLINGQKPWQNFFNYAMATMTIIQDGVLYTLVECDNLEVFADRGVYLGVNKGNYFEADTFNYDKKTGKISTNPYYSETHALFQLPLDSSKADHVKAEVFILKQRLVDLTKPYDPETSVDYANEIETGEIIPASEKVVSYDSYGLLYYEYEDDYMSGRVKDFFSEGQTGLSDYILPIVDDDFTIRRAIRFSMESDGTITGVVYELGWLFGR